MRTQQALRACAEWLGFCLKIGWRKEDLDALERLWWQYHDDQGRLTVWDKCENREAER
jgi:hypothetical protein